MSSSQYVGTELDVFAHAVNWKAYLRRQIAPFLRGHVLEVGAGLGATTCTFRGAGQVSWLALEPDPALAHRLRQRIRNLRDPVEVVEGTISALARQPRFDCILYIDVLEHIPDDRTELEEARDRLASGGALIVLSPAHQFLYSPFDEAIGHYRRYSRRQLARISPASMAPEQLRYLDSAGLILSTANRVLLRSASPTLSQVLVWDRWCVPVSRRLDGLLGGRVGKSVLAVWRKS